MQKTMQQLVGKFVEYQKPNYAWQFGKVKEVVLYTRGPKKGKLRYARISTRQTIYNKDGSMKIGKNGYVKTKWTGPCRRTTKIYEVLKGKNTWVPLEKWLA